MASSRAGFKAYLQAVTPKGCGAAGRELQKQTLSYYYPALIWICFWHAPSERDPGIHIFEREADMKTTRHIALATVGVALAFMFGCNSDKSNQDVYYMIAANVQLPYWKTAANGFKRAASEYQVTAKVTGPTTYDPVAELDALQQAMRAKPAGILISVADAAVLEREINEAVQLGIPVITMDSDAAITRRLYFIGTNNVDAGRLGGSRLIEKLTKGNIAILTIPGQPNLEERLRGLKEVLNTQPGLKITEIADVKGDAATAFDKAQQLVAETGSKKIDAFVCLEAVAGKPVADAIKRANAKDREVIAWDADPATLDAIKDGTIDATIAQKPYTMGYFGLRMLYNVAHKPPQQMNKDFRSDFYSPFPVFMDTGTTLVDRGNVDLYMSATAAASETQGAR
jgi:ribose transport system substrate-binding protein